MKQVDFFPGPITMCYVIGMEVDSSLVGLPDFRPGVER